MKTKLTLVATATLLMAAPLVAANAPGFENFMLSRNDFKSNPSSTLANFSSRTHSEDDTGLTSFSSRKPCGFILKIR